MVAIEKIDFAMAKNALKDLTCYGNKALTIKKNGIHEKTQRFYHKAFSTTFLIRYPCMSLCS